MNRPNNSDVTQGGVANKQGKILENTIIPTFEARGFEVVSFPRWKRSPEQFGTELLLTNVPYQSIYHHVGKTEFLAKSERFSLNTRIECKWQQSSGSVDEKYPYLYLNCIETIPERDIIVVYGGGGMKKGAIEWLKKAAKEKKYQAELQEMKNIQILSLEEFIMWANMVLWA